MHKLWFAFALAFLLSSTDQLSILWEMMSRRALGA